MLQPDNHEDRCAECLTHIAGVLSELSRGAPVTSGDIKLDAITDRLVAVISILSKISREASSQVNKLRETEKREHEAMRVLGKFKKVARQQKNLIEALEAERREIPPLPLAPTCSARSTNTDIAQCDMLRMSEDVRMLQRQLVLLSERDLQLAALTKDLKRREEENGRLRIILKRAEGVIEAQHVLVDELEAEARRNRPGPRSLLSTPAGTPSRDITITSRNTYPHDASTANSSSFISETAEDARTTSNRQAPLSYAGIVFPEFAKGNAPQLRVPLRPQNTGKERTWERDSEYISGEEQEQEEDECEEGEQQQEEEDDEHEGEQQQQEEVEEEEEEEEEQEELYEEGDYTNTASGVIDYYEDENWGEEGDEQEREGGLEGKWNVGAEEHERGVADDGSLRLSLSVEISRGEKISKPEDIHISALWANNADAAVDDSFSVIQRYYKPG